MDPGSAGARLDRFVSARIPRLSRSRAARLEVVDLAEPDRPLKKSAKVCAGQRLWVRRPLPDADADRPVLSVLHQDADLLVLDKPAGLATHPTASRFVRTVTWWLRVHAPGAEPAHRLDVETSGVLLCGRHPEADRALKAAFAAEQVQKTYRAVVEGAPPDQWTCAAPLGFAAESAVRIKMGPGALPSVTDFEVLARGHGRALVAARPRTGRQHQIRVHAALSGFPLVGDKLYGPDERLFLASLERALGASEVARLGHHRQALHAASVALTWAGVERRFESPVPDELAALLRAGAAAR